MDIVLEILFKEYTLVYRAMCAGRTNPESHMKTFEDVLQHMAYEGIIEQSGNGNHWKSRVKFTATRETLLDSISTDLFLQAFIIR